MLHLCIQFLTVSHVIMIRVVLDLETSLFQISASSHKFLLDFTCVCLSSQSCHCSFTLACLILPCFAQALPFVLECSFFKMLTLVPSTHPRQSSSLPSHYSISSLYFWSCNFKISHTKKASFCIID